MKFTPPGGRVELHVEWREASEPAAAGAEGGRRAGPAALHTQHSTKRWVNVLHTSEEAPEAHQLDAAQAGSEAGSGDEAPAPRERRNSLWKPVSLLTRFLGAGIRLAPGHGAAHHGSQIVFRVCDTGIGARSLASSRWPCTPAVFFPLRRRAAALSDPPPASALRPRQVYRRTRWRARTPRAAPRRSAFRRSAHPAQPRVRPRVRQERIFEPFVQADTASNRQYQGTGLGLTVRSNSPRRGSRRLLRGSRSPQSRSSAPARLTARASHLPSSPPRHHPPQICRKLAHAMNGALTLSSVVGEGSEFTLSIPATAVEEGGLHRRAAVRPPPPAQQPVRLKRRRRGVLEAEPSDLPSDFRRLTTRPTRATRGGTR